VVEILAIKMVKKMIDEIAVVLEPIPFTGIL